MVTHSTLDKEVYNIGNVSLLSPQIKKFLLSGIFFLGIPAFLLAQGVVKLTNPSFEGPPAHSIQPPFWSDCGFQGQSPPDTHPAGYWGVSKSPYHGGTYLGLVVRYDQSWESVGQQLYTPFVAGQCYEFSAYMCMSEEYLSPTRHDLRKEYSFTTPAVLRIWGANSICQREELLAESVEVDNLEWMKFNFKIKPRKSYKYIVVEAFYKTPVLTEYNGNILVDNLSDFTPVDCDVKVIPKELPDDEQDTVASVKSNSQKKQESKTLSTSPNTSSKLSQKPITSDVVYSDISKLKNEDIKKGNIIRMDDLYFKADSVKVHSSNYPTLNMVYNMMQKNPTMKIEIGGHTNGLPAHEYCNKISEQRAKSVADYLVNKGIPKDRISYKGYGKTNPISDNSTVEGRKKNQRVEIKILDVR